MIIYDKDANVREFSRSGALTLKTAKLADDVDLGDEVSLDFNFEEGVLHLNKAEPVAEGEHPEFMCVLKEVGLFGLKNKLKTRVEIIFCDDYMLMNVLEGSIIINMGGEIMRVTRGIDEESLPACHKDEIKWVSVEDIKQYCIPQLSKLGSEKYLQDFIFVMDMSGCGGDNYLVSFKPASAPLDVSGGAIARKLEEEVLKEQAREVKRMMNMVTATNRTYSFSEKLKVGYDDEDVVYEDEVEDASEYYDDEEYDNY